MFKMFSAIAVSGLLAGSMAFAQSSRALQASVPFPFTVHNRTFSPGAYRVSYETASHVLFIRQLGRSDERALVIATPDSDPKGTRGQSRLVFSCDAHGACDLAQVWQGGGEGSGLVLPERERKLSFATRIVTMSLPK
ncbi:MAG TPA: hypothetical protein VMF91_00210 [Bryobacteraceae bacterium]|nr:hypothetical protein [Bryobacteraceae bacterium]